jgi:hypothetical protein
MWLHSTSRLHTVTIKLYSSIQRGRQYGSCYAAVVHWISIELLKSKRDKLVDYLFVPWVAVAYDTEDNMVTDGGDQATRLPKHTGVGSFLA